MCKYLLTFVLFVCFSVPRYFNDKHNIVALVDPEQKEAFQYQDIIRFLRRSRIFTTISAQPVIVVTSVDLFDQYQCENKYQIFIWYKSCDQNIFMINKQGLIDNTRN